MDDGPELIAFYHNVRESWLNWNIDFGNSLELYFIWDDKPFWIDYTYSLKSNFYLIKDSINKGSITYSEIDDSMILLVYSRPEDSHFSKDYKREPDFFTAMPITRYMLWI